MNLNFFKNHKEICLLITIFFLLYSFISVVKHLHYQTFTWDTGFFDQLIWKLSHFKNPISSFSGLHIFGDHFQFVLLFFVPLYWLPKSIFLLFISHALIGAIASLPLYLLSQELNKNKLVALSISFSFLIFTSFQFAILDGFHQSVFVPLFYILAFYAQAKRLNNIYWVSIAGLLLVKEEMALLVIAIAVVTFLLGERKKGIVTALLGISVFIFAVYYFLPKVQGTYVHASYGELGETPLEVLVNIVSNPNTFFKLLVIPDEKVRTVFQAFFSFGFLAILSPTTLIPALQQFVVRFIDTVTVHRWTALNHYSFPIAAIFSVSTVFAIKFIAQKFTKLKSLSILLSAYLLFFAFSQDLIFHGPINSIAKKDFYIKKDWMKDNDKILNYLPQDASVAATNNFGPHVSQRDNFYLISENNDAEYLLFDLEDGPNKYSPLNYALTLSVFNREIEQGNYVIVKQINKAFLLKKE